MFLRLNSKEYWAKLPDPVAHWDKRRKAAATIAAGVSLDGVCRHFGSIRAVDDFSLDIAPAEIVCLLGPSGCGKTTLLRIVAGIDRPAAGRVLIGGIEVAGATRFLPPEKRGVGLMFQDFALFPHLRIIENVAFGLKRLGRETALKEAQAALDRIGLGAYSNDYPHVLSGGQQQRVALARAIVPRPSVLLMDEPFSGLDPCLRGAVRDETLAILREARATALIVTHDAEEAMRLGDRIAVMRAGRLVQSGKAEELYLNPADVYVAQTFSGVNVMPCSIEAGAAYCALGSFRADGMRDGEAVICLRQNEIDIVKPGSGCPGRVIASKFLGGEALLEIAVQGIEDLLMVRVCCSGAPLPGAEVGIAVEPAKALIFAAHISKVRPNGRCV